MSNKINDFVNKLSMNEVVLLQEKLNEITANRLRTYNVTFTVSFRADRIDDISDPEMFADHVIDAFSYLEFGGHGGITGVEVKEVE